MGREADLGPCDNLPHYHPKPIPYTKMFAARGPPFMMMRPFGLSLVMSLLLAGLGGCSTQELAIHDAWIPEAPSMVSALAGYMTVENNSGRVRTLVGATGPLFERVEVHRTVYEKDSGLARMIPQDQVRIEPGQRFPFQPGGYHLMLISPKEAPKAGGRVTLTLVFADGSRPTVDFEVRRDRLRL